MAYEKYYFEHDYYGVGFYEEVVTSELEQGRAAAANASHSEEITGILGKLSHLNARTDHNYNRQEKTSTRGKYRERVRGKREPVLRKPTRCCRKYCQRQYKFTPEQVLELDRVFEETHYPDASKRRELAKLINVEECTVKVWFNNRRAKLRKNQKALMCKSTPPSKETWFPLKILKETKSVIVLQEPLMNGFFYYEPHVGHPNWQ